MSKDVSHPSLPCQHIFENVYYLPVEKRSFQDIQIELLTMDGERHFKRNSNAFKSTPTLSPHFRVTFKNTAVAQSSCSYNDTSASGILSPTGG
jgi:hypothetical protein